MQEAVFEEQEQEAVFEEQKQDAIFEEQEQEAVFVEQGQENQKEPEKVCTAQAACEKEDARKAVAECQLCPSLLCEAWRHLHLPLASSAGKGSGRTPRYGANPADPKRRELCARGTRPPPSLLPLLLAREPGQEP